MSKPKVKSVASLEERSLPIFAEFDAVAEQIRDRAFKLFCDRGYSAGSDWDDWLAAERDICWPASELVENDEFTLRLELAGYDADNINVTATPRELIVKAVRENTDNDEASSVSESIVRWSELHSEDVYRKVELPSDIDPDKVTAEFKHGVLTVKAPKSGQAKLPTTRVRVSSAA